MSNAGVADETSPARSRAARASTSDVVVASAAVATVGAVFSGLEPTGTSWWDPVLAASVAIAFVVGATRASSRTLFAAVAIGALATGFTPWLAVGVAACVTYTLASQRTQHTTELRAVTGALSSIALFHLDDFGVFGLSAALAGAAIVGVVVSAYRRATVDARKPMRRVALVVGAAVALVLAIGGVQALLTRSTVNTGVEAARAAIEAARSGDPGALSREIGQAQESLAEADDRVSSPILQPLYLVPVAAQHLRAVSTATEHGLEVADEALAAAEEGGIEDLQMRQGQFDLDKLALIAPRLERAASALGDAMRTIERDRSPWLLPPVDDRLGSLLAEVAEVRQEADLAARAANVLPRMLGADAERRYLLLFGSPGEAREFGGFVGGYAVLAVDDGRLDLVRAGGINDLVPIANEGELDNPNSYPTEFLAADPVTFPQNLTSTPSITTIARAARDIFPELFGAPIDGVVYLDPYALAAMTELSGPVEVEGIGRPLVGDDIVDFLFDGQYRLFDSDERDDRFEAIGELASAMAEAFASADLPGPEELGRLLGPAARGGRLQVVTYDDEENAFLTAVRLQREFSAPPGLDSFALVHANATPSKLDLFLHRDVRYDVQVAPDGSLRAVLDVELRSVVPDDAPELTFGFTDGTNEVLLSLYSPHELVSVTVDGETHEYVAEPEFGFVRYSLFRIPLPADEQAHVRFELLGTAPEDDYRLGVWQQPLVNDDELEIVYRNGENSPISVRRALTEGWLFDPGTASPEQ